MSKSDKLLQKIQNGPNNATMNDILTLMEHYGFKAKRTAHGYFFSHEKLMDEELPHVAEPNGPNNKVLKTYVKQCLKAIELLNVHRETEDQ